jgi:hypothetical protein
MQEAKIVGIFIPSEVDFSDLQLAYENDGDISFNSAVFKHVCLANGITQNDIASSNDGVGGFVAKWYVAHIRAGGEKDPVAEDMISEVHAEHEAGQTVGFPAGHA